MRAVRSVLGSSARLLLAAALLTVWHLDCECDAAQQHRSLTCGCSATDQCAAHHGHGDCTLAVSASPQTLATPPLPTTATPWSPPVMEVRRVAVAATPIRAGPTPRRLAARAPPTR